VEEKVRVDDVTWGEIDRPKRFRRYVQIIEQGMRPIYFKELGDPRLISGKSGNVFKDEQQLQEIDGPDAFWATEVLHFRVASPRTAYGIPRWIGVLLSVLGSRQVDEVNFSYFDNKSVPPLLVTVADGRMTDESVERMRTHIDTEVKGKRNFHKILILEAETNQEPGQQHSGRAKIDVKPLTMAQHNDALFQKYDERNMDKVGMAFRLPRLLRGDIRDFNRATADAALEFAEMQVFVPEREDFDFVMNRVILPLLGIRFWLFKSNSPQLTDPQEQGKLIVEMVKEGVLVPAEGRQEAEKVLNRELPKIDAPWTRLPVAMTLAGQAPPPEPMPETEDGEEGEKEPEPEAAEIDLTGTDMAAIVTVNEVRHGQGLGPLKLPSGDNDPDGFLTVFEFKAKRMAAGQVGGAAEAREEAGIAEKPAEGGNGKPEVEAKAFSSGDLGAGGGLLNPAQLSPDDEDEDRYGKRVVKDAAYLLQLRNAMDNIELAEAERDFDAGQAADAAAQED
jgi:PBSX family phage portal protein